MLALATSAFEEWAAGALSVSIASDRAAVRKLRNKRVS